VRAGGAFRRPRSARAAEEGVARHVDAPAVEALPAMLEHRPVDLCEDVEAHGDFEVGRDADEVAVEGGVVELAERQAVGKDRLAQGMAVGEAVGVLIRRSGGTSSRKPSRHRQPGARRERST
jgi:hypothetical protein